MSHANLDDCLINYEFAGAGILHVGGARADNGLIRNRFTPFFKMSKDMNDANLLQTLQPFVENGIKNGVTLLLDAEVYDYTFIHQKSIGFQLGINHPFDVALASSSGCFIQPGKQVFVAVTASAVETSKKIRQRFNYNGTKCHFDGEVELDHFPSKCRYSMNNCMLESYVQQVEEFCNCSHVVAETQPLEVCTGDEMLLCIELEDIGRGNSIKNKGEQVPCLANCNDIEYSSSVSTRAAPLEQISYRFLPLRPLRFIISALYNCRNSS